MLVDLDLVTLSTSYPDIFKFVLTPSCFASYLISVNWGFYRLILISLSPLTVFEVPTPSVLSQRFYLHKSMCANRIAPGPSIHTLTFNTSINIMSKNRLDTNL